MALSRKLEHYLTRHGARYDLVSHPRSSNSIQTADAADIPGDRVVKAVVLKDDDGLVLAVLPSTLSVHLGHLTTLLGRRFRLADEEDLAALFDDCAPGAIPPVGIAYGVRSLLDDSLETLEDVFFEAGDHETLVHMTAKQFFELAGPAPRVHFGQSERHKG